MVKIYLHAAEWSSKKKKKVSVASLTDFMRSCCHGNELILTLNYFLLAVRTSLDTLSPNVVSQVASQLYIIKLYADTSLGNIYYRNLTTILSETC